MSVEPRSANVDDAPALARVQVEAWRSAYAGILPDRVLVQMSEPDLAVDWARLLTRPMADDAVLVAETPTHGVVGFGSAGPRRCLSQPRGGEVYTLYVHPDFHDAGFGRRLLAGLLRGLAARRFQSAVVWVLAANPARFFYHAMGAVQCGERHETLWGVPVAQVALGWNDLKAASACIATRRLPR